jgi:hypothetical protein
VPTNSPQALVQLLQYWKTNNTILPSVVTNQSSNFFQIAFVYRPAETGVTYHVQTSTNFNSWSDIATYSGSHSTFTAKAQEVSRVGSSDVGVTVRDLSGINGQTEKFLRLAVTRP